MCIRDSYKAEEISKELGFNLWLKREDLNHTGAHKINNALGQVLLAKKMGKKRIIAETGAGQHGVATAAVAAYKIQAVIFVAVYFNLILQGVTIPKIARLIFQRSSPTTTTP